MYNDDKYNSRHAEELMDGAGITNGGWSDNSSTNDDQSDYDAYKQERTDYERKNGYGSWKERNYGDRY